MKFSYTLEQSLDFLETISPSTFVTVEGILKNRIDFKTSVFGLVHDVFDELATVDDSNLEIIDRYYSVSNVLLFALFDKAKDSLHFCNDQLRELHILVYGYFCKDSDFTISSIFPSLCGLKGEGRALVTGLFECSYDDFLDSNFDLEIFHR